MSHFPQVCIGPTFSNRGVSDSRFKFILISSALSLFIFSIGLGKSTFLWKSKGYLQLDSTELFDSPEGLLGLEETAGKVHAFDAEKHHHQWAGEEHLGEEQIHTQLDNVNLFIVGYCIESKPWKNDEKLD